MSKSLCDKTIQVLAGYLAKACRSENYCNYIILLKGNLPPSRTYQDLFSSTGTSKYMMREYACISTVVLPLMKMGGRQTWKMGIYN